MYDGNAEAECGTLSWKIDPPDLHALLDELDVNLRKNTPRGQQKLQKTLDLLLMNYREDVLEKQKMIRRLGQGMWHLSQPCLFTMFWLYLMAQEHESFYWKSSENWVREDFTAECQMFHSLKAQVSFRFQNCDPVVQQFLTSESSGMTIWGKVCSYLKLSPSQVEELKLRRIRAQKLKVQLHWVYKHISCIREKLCHETPQVHCFFNLNKILSRNQFTKLVLWVRKDPACKDILDALWGTLMQKYDRLYVEQKRSSLFYRQAKRKIQTLSARQAASCFCYTLKERFKVVRRTFHPNIQLVDVNNHIDVTGLMAVQRYLERVGNAFNGALPGNVVELSLVVDEESGKIASSWQLVGHYTGKLLKNTEEGKFEFDKNKFVLEDNQYGYLVDFNVVSEFVFGNLEHPELITELYIHWDVPGLMKQLAIVTQASEEKRHQEMTDTLTSVTTVSPASASTIDSTTERFKEKCSMIYERLVTRLADAYENNQDAVEPVVHELFTKNIMIEEMYRAKIYSGHREVLAYYKRQKKVFPTLNVLSHHCVSSGRLQFHQNGPRGFVCDPTRGTFQAEAIWNMEGMYNGRLVKGKGGKKCVFMMHLLMECSIAEQKIRKMRIIMECHDLMLQLGVVD